MSKVIAGKRIIIEVPINGTLTYPAVGDLRGKAVTITLVDPTVDSVRAQLEGNDSTDYEEVVISASSATVDENPGGGGP